MLKTAKPMSRSCQTVVMGGHFSLHPSLANGRVSQVSETELATFERAIATISSLHKTAPTACLTLVIGDLELPPASRGDIDLALPEAYRVALEAAGLGEVAIVAESRCRNLGTGKVVAGLKKQLQTLGGERLYAEYGIGLVTLGEGEARCLFLIADALLDEAGPHDAVIALTRPGTGAPTCPVLISGALVDVAASGARRYVAFYDTEDDPDVEKKLVEGVYAAGLARPALDLSCDLVISANAALQSRRSIETAGLRRPGRRGSLENLVRAARQAMRRHSQAWVVAEPVALTN